MNTKTKASHTPGPWSLGFEEYIWDEASTPPQKRRSTRIDAEQHSSLAFVATDISHMEGDANARLIAAAPELLEACKAVANDPYTTCACAEKVRAAIAKAEGTLQNRA